MSADDARPATPSRAWRWRLGAGALALVLLVLPCLAARQALRRPPPPPPFSASELGTAPPASDNGWAVVSARAGSLGGAAPHVGPVYLDTTSFESLRAHATELTDAAHTPETARRLAAFDEARRLPRYAHGTPPAMLVGEQVMPHLRVFDAAVLRALDDALSGRSDAALAAATDLVRMAGDYARTAHSLLAAMLSVALLDRTVWLARILAEGASGADSPPARGPVVALAGALAALDLHALSAAPAVAGEELAFRDMLLAAMRAPASASVLPSGGLFGDARLLDVHDTLARADAYYVALHAYARDPSHAARPPVPVDPTSAPLWFLWNVPGKRLLSMMTIDLAPQIDRYERKKTEVDAVRLETISALDGLLAPPPPPTPPVR